MIALLLATAARGDELSIEDALRNAIGASEAVELAVAAVDRTSGQHWQAISGALPQLSLNAGYTHTFKSEYDDLFGGASGLPFGQANSYTVRFSASQAIFGGGRLSAGLKIDAATRRTTDLALESAKAAAALDVARAYYDAALADRLLAIASQTKDQSDAALNDTRLQYQVQRKPEFDLLRAQVQSQNDAVAVLRQQRVRDDAFVHLAQLLDLPVDALVLTTPVDDPAAPSVAPVAVDAVGISPGDEKVAVRQATEAVLISKQSVAISRSQWFPTVSLAASYGWSSYPDSVLFSVNPDDWKANVSAGLNLTVPVFSGGRIHGEVVAAKADLVVASVQAEQVGEAAEAESRDAAAELHSAEAQYEATAGSVDQANRAYAIAELRFKEGVSTQLELSDARLLLEQSLANRAQAARDLQVARVRTALLPLLPLSTGAVP
jgi:outer membrane protein TolC